MDKTAAGWRENIEIVDTKAKFEKQEHSRHLESAAA